MAQRNDDLLTRLLAGLTVRGILLHPATLFVFASLATIGSAIQLWHRYQQSIVKGDDFRLTAEKIQLNEQPEWSGIDLKKILLEHVADEEEASLLDTGLIANTVKTFKSVGFVEQVKKVEKSKLGLNIELSYRDAVGMVELNPTTVPNWPPNQDGQLLPVDRHGIIMPGKLISVQALLRFSVFDPVRFTKLETWSEWPDERVKGCAEIGELLGQRWQEMGLYRVVTFRKPNQELDTSIPFELWPDNGVQVIWGNPPGQETASEASATKKLAALEAFVEKYGPLNTLAKARIDLRSGTAIRSSHERPKVAFVDSAPVR